MPRPGPLDIRFLLYYQQGSICPLILPLTVKMRTGWSRPILAVENALLAEAAGVFCLYAREILTWQNAHWLMQTRRPFIRLHKLWQKSHLSPTGISRTVRAKNTNNASKKLALTCCRDWTSAGGTHPLTKSIIENREIPTWFDLSEDRWKIAYDIWNVLDRSLSPRANTHSLFVIPR